uniref:Oxidoreductase n=1 Tax=Solanum tuberosum TaxID=4113 RepID=M1C7D6_SOLTU
MLGHHHRSSKTDRFLLDYNADELRIAGEFLSNWFPFLSLDFCSSCTHTLSRRIRFLGRERTYTAPQKWMRGKGRVTIQFGCCYNYATDKKGNSPGILKSVTVDPLPDLLKNMIRRLVKWHVLPPDCVPDSCVVNIYDVGDCIPPHIDSNDFVRPFCTVSFLSECNIVLGSNLKTVGPGDFAGAIAIPLPMGSVLVLNGNGADVAKHCVPAVPTKRISITFRRMNKSRRPIGCAPEQDLLGLQPLSHEADRYEKSKTYKPWHSKQLTRT